jgi:hypothetical protein
MNIATFLQHYQITENPFRAEEARHDAVFGRVETACHHPDYEKICGDFDKPSSSIVFGEKGSGKTAIRLQIEDELREHNRARQDHRCLTLVYDELNPVLDRFSRTAGKKSTLEKLRQFQLVDHIDAMMSAIVPKIVDQAPEHSHKRFRQLDSSAKHDLMLLQICYDRPEEAATRTRRLKRALRLRSRNSIGWYLWTAGIMGLLGLAGVAYFLFESPAEHVWLWHSTFALVFLFAAIMAGRAAWLSWVMRRLAGDLSRQLRALDRSRMSFRQSLRAIHVAAFAASGLPLTDDDDLRYAMFGRMLNVVRPFGYESILVLVDRVDEPTLINGEPERMRAFVWPMLNNKFLQQDRVGVKLLLPLELRHLLNRESAEFYREARLDKQNLIERLTWSGAVLYDLCTARLNACRTSTDGAMALSLRDLFEESVTAQDLIDALDQMQQPRDAFKFIYQVIQEHCANVPEERPTWKISRPTLDAVRKQQVERVSGVLRGVRPG